MNTDKLTVMANFVEDLAGLAHCKRRKVGAITFDPWIRSVASIGYNGPARQEPNDRCTGVDGCGCLHAEANALIKGHGEVMMITLAPCEHCAGLIINAGIKLVYFLSYCYDLESGSRMDQGLERLYPLVAVCHLARDVPQGRVKCQNVNEER